MTTTSSEAKHTPGPWKVEKSNVIGQIDARFGAVLHLIVPDRPGDDAGLSVLTYTNHVANAALIARAPSMADALTRTASGLAEVEAAVACIIERGADPETLTALDHVREALIALAAGCEVR